ncbi:DNA topoisomerase 1-like [Leptopilina boulardi]|uniref:DNA topoisomerase 1-like n=1 Tax=Leptopilina boulardi TaxID=63433 RepID=UPI0021F58CCD|nr:DNA topoisomerase 1-like [Leptopilina boulardi]
MEAVLEELRSLREKVEGMEGASVERHKHRRKHRNRESRRKNGGERHSDRGASRRDRESSKNSRYRHSGERSSHKSDRRTSHKKSSYRSRSPLRRDNKKSDGERYPENSRGTSRQEYDKSRDSCSDPQSYYSDYEEQTDSNFRSSSCQSTLTRSCSTDTVPDSPKNKDENNETKTDDNKENKKEPSKQTIQLLGSDDTEKFGPEIHDSIVEKWTNYLKLGLQKDEKKVLIEKYPTAKNFPMLKAPDLNPEIKELAKGIALKKDSFYIASHTMLSADMNAIALCIDELLTQKEPNIDQIISRLGDSGRLLSGLHHSLSISRRITLTSSIESLDPLVKSVATDCVVDKQLFGEDFAEKYKKAKTLEKTSKELIKAKQGSSSRQPYEKYKQKTNQYDFPRKQNNLNWRGPPKRVSRNQTTYQQGGRNSQHHQQSRNNPKYRR